MEGIIERLKAEAAKVAERHGDDVSGIYVFEDVDGTVSVEIGTWRGPKCDAAGNLIGDHDGCAARDELNAFCHTAGAELEFSGDGENDDGSLRIFTVKFN